MKQRLAIVGGIFLILILAVAGVIGYAAYQGQRLDASSEAYFEEMVLAIIPIWSKDELLKRSSPQLLKVLNANPEQLDWLFQKISKLGAMRSFGDVKGESGVSYTTDNGRVATAAYVATAKFENGEARITARLIQLDGQWQVLVFHVDSPLFINEQANQSLH